MSNGKNTNGNGTVARDIEEAGLYLLIDDITMASVKDLSLIHI